MDFYFDGFRESSIGPGNVIKIFKRKLNRFTWSKSDGKSVKLVKRRMIKRTKEIFVLFCLHTSCYFYFIFQLCALIFYLFRAESGSDRIEMNAEL